MCASVFPKCIHVYLTCNHTEYTIRVRISVCLLDMEKFPLRMKDNDLLITQLFEDPLKEPITSLSVYLTPNVCE